MPVKTLIIQLKYRFFFRSDKATQIINLCYIESLFIIK